MSRAEGHGQRGGLGPRRAVVQRLLAVVASVLPLALSESARDLVAEHLDDVAAQRATLGRAVTGSALWARDVYDALEVA
jgi:hypothetical protein